MSDARLDVRGVGTPSRRGRTILRDVTFSLGPSDVIAVVGESGVGKTTLLRVLAGLERFSSGSIRLGDLTITPSDRKNALVGHVGFVFQGFELFPHLTAVDNCTLALRLARGLDPQAARTRAETTLCDLGLADHLDKHPRELSGGERQRVAIARALVVAPALLLYDEPTSALDAERKADVRRMIGNVRPREIPQIIVTHDLASIEEVCTAVFTLKDGVIAEVARP